MSEEIKQVKTNDLKHLSSSQIEDLINIFKEQYNEDVNIMPYKLQNQKKLAEMLNEYEYDAKLGLSFSTIHEQINKVEPEPVEPVEPEQFYEERRGYDDSEDYIYQLQQERNEIQNQIEALRDHEQAINDEMKSIMNIPASNEPIQRPHDERQAEYEINQLMNIETGESRLQKSHEERYQAHVQEASNGILNGHIDKSLNEELTKFVNKHSLAHLECDEALILFQPIDMDKFRASLRRIGYTINSVKKEKHNIYTNYFLNRITEIGFIFDSLDRIYEENKGHPFKINFDCGFVVEDTKEIKYTRTAPTEDNVGRTIPVIISKDSDIETYKHYVWSAISEKTEMTHQNSSQHYCAIHTILFKVTNLGTSGAKITVPGYDFLLKKRVITYSPNDYNLCFFSSMSKYMIKNGVKF